MDDNGPKNIGMEFRKNVKSNRKNVNTEILKSANMDSQKSDDVDTQSSIYDPVKINQPKPTDFDIFLPWACEQFRPDLDVIVTRAAQKMYGSTALQEKKLAMKRKQSTLTSTTKQEHILDVDYQSSSHKSAVSPVTGDKVKIETVYDSQENLVQLKFFKNKIIPRKVMQVIALTIPYQKYLTSININGGLRMDTLYEMSKFLADSQITEICLDGTFLREANYHVLLKQSKLKHLSLARCTINDDVVKTIADQLKAQCPAATVLSALNLSTNRITDIGAKYLAVMLRGNRQLGYLNLAGNMIADEGVRSILGSLNKFPLQLHEITESRAKYVAYLKKKNTLVSKLVKELRMEPFVKWQNKKKPITKSKLETAQLIVTESEAHIIQERAQRLAEKKLGLFNDPFSLNNTETRDGVVHCLGNNTLCYLNLAYNNLSYVSVKELLEVLTVQASLNRTPVGLIKVVIEGNLMPESCEEYKKIVQLLGADKLRSKRHSEIISKKKPSSAKSNSLSTSLGKSK